MGVISFITELTPMFLLLIIGSAALLLIVFIWKMFPSTALFRLTIFSSVVLPGIPLMASLPRVRLDDFIGFSIFSLFFIHISVKRRFLVPLTRETIFIIRLLLLFSLIVTLSVLISPLLDVPFNIKDWWDVIKPLKYIGLILLGYAYIFTHPKNGIKEAYFILIASYVLSALMAFLEWYGWDKGFGELLVKLYAPPVQVLHYEHIRRAVGTGQDPNMGGKLIAFGILFLLPFTLEKFKHKFLSLTLMSILLLGLLTISSRTSLVALVLSGIAFWFLSFIKQKRHRINKALTILLFGILVYFLTSCIISFVSPIYLSNFSKIILNPFASKSFQGRLHDLERASRLWLDSPVFGWGPAKSFIGYEGIKKFVIETEYLYFLVHYGLIGLVVGILFYLYPLIVFGKYISRRSEVHANSGCNNLIFSVFLCNLFVIVAGVTQSTFFDLQTMNHFSLLLGIGLGVLGSGHNRWSSMLR